MSSTSQRALPQKHSFVTPRSRVGFSRWPTRIRFLSLRGRTEAYGGLFLLLLGIAVLTFGGCPTKNALRNTRPANMPPKSGGTSLLPSSVGFGNAVTDGKLRKGWWVGHFMSPTTAQHATDVETKWVSHLAGAKHGRFSTNTVATSMAILITGKHRIEFEETYVVLENPGDYVIWGPGVAHSWTSLKASTLLCVRWPSIAHDQDKNHGDTQTIDANVPRLDRNNNDALGDNQPGHGFIGDARNATRHDANGGNGLSHVFQGADNEFGIDTVVRKEVGNNHLAARDGTARGKLAKRDTTSSKVVKSREQRIALQNISHEPAPGDKGKLQQHRMSMKLLNDSNANREP